MAVTNQQIIDYLLANPNLSDAQIAATMQEFSVTPTQLAQAVGADPAQIQARYAEAAPNVYTAENVNKLASQILAQNTTEKWTGGLPPEKAALYMADELAKSGVSDIAQVGKGADGIINQMTGEKLISGYGERTGGNLWSGSYEGKGNTGFGVEFDAQGKPVFYTQGASSSTLGKDILKLAAVAGAVYGLGGFDGLLGGAGTAGTAAGTAFDVANAGIAGGTAAFTPAELAAIGSGTATGIGAGGAGATGLLTTPAATTTTAGGTGLKLGTSGLDTITATNSGLNTLTTGANTGLLTGTVGTTLAGLDTGVTAATAASTAAAAKIAADAKLAADAATAAKLASQTGLITGGLKTAAGLIQSEEDKAAAQKAAADVTKATQASVAGAQFRPVGMTTRFGTSQYTYDPVTGQMVSAGYQLSPEAKAQQDRLMALSNAGLTQAEQAQAQYAPLQTGAQRLFGLGNQYLAQSPEEVAQNYLNQQMALLQPGREVELANLQNRLYQQGRQGVSVAQGGTMGATTPELRALYNARAQQEAQLGVNAQQYGQQNVLFGAGLLGQGASAMGNYYGGQTQAFSPYTTAMGQVTGLETAGQQPLTMGANLAQQASTAGYNAGRLGLQGAGTAADISMGKAATTNPYASLLTGIADPTFAAGVAKQIWGV